MKQYNYLLKIEEPCKEKWADMTANDNGRYCASCSKNVIDFTQLSDKEIIKILEQNKGKLCGRLDVEQLNRTLVPTIEMPHSPRLYKLFAGLLFLSSSSNLISRERHSPFQIIQNTKNDKAPIASDEYSNQYLHGNDSLKNIVEGKVIDSETSDPLPFATVIIEGTKVGSTTDIDGKFKITVPDSLLSDSIKFSIMYIGYLKTNFIVHRKDLPITREILIIPSPRMMLGAMVMTTLPPRKKWWQSRKKFNIAAGDK